MNGLLGAWLQGLQDSHAKVRWAACQALGQMCTDLGPELQSSQHQRVLPGLMAVMDDFSQPRVQVRTLMNPSPPRSVAAAEMLMAPSQLRLQHIYAVYVLNLPSVYAYSLRGNFMC